MPREVIDAGGVIEAAGFTIIDDLLHGYGGGYLPPVLGSRSLPPPYPPPRAGEGSSIYPPPRAGEGRVGVPDEPFRAGMTVVIQPNVVTPDGRAGVQTGELVVITETGIEPLHAVPRGFLRL